MSLKVGFLTEPVETLNIDKLSSVKIFNEGKARGHEGWYFSTKDIFFDGRELYAKAKDMTFLPDKPTYPRFEKGEEKTIKIKDLDVFLLRKDPPVTQEYMILAHLLKNLEDDVFFVNSPRGIVNTHSKMTTLNFPQFIPETLFSLCENEIYDFIKRHKKVIVKPTDAMGGKGIMILNHDDLNLKSIIQTVRFAYNNLVLFQRFLPEAVSHGDKRIILFDGECYGAITRRAAEGDFRSNISAGGSFEKAELTDREQEIVTAVKPYLQENGLFFCGLDTIGGYLTEINTISPGALTWANQAYGKKFENIFWDVLEKKLAK